MPRKTTQPVLVLKATIRLVPNDPDAAAIKDPETIVNQVIEELDGTEIYWEDPEGEREDGVSFDVDLRDVELTGTERS